MTHRVTNAGAFFAYVGRGLGISPGVGSAYLSPVAYITIPGFTTFCAKPSQFIDDPADLPRFSADVVRRLEELAS